jgi:hypothetical protein
MRNASTEIDTMNALQQPASASSDYERGLQALRRMLDMAIAQARLGEGQPPTGEALKRRLRDRLARRKPRT